MYKRLFIIKCLKCQGLSAKNQVEGEVKVEGETVEEVDEVEGVERSRLRQLKPLRWLIKLRRFREFSMFVNRCY
ncbi:hypothetical protein [Flexistipes sp.]|uniref:hypothetical protein n=1 Tax=Flexistipes sp. TaxID=3088135 RepID=UPI002E1B7682